MALVATLFAATFLSACEQSSQSNNKSPLPTVTSNIVERGQYLAVAGNCAGCHTPIGQAEFSGGRAIKTPFGDVITSNLTPDNDTGLGKWNSEDFWKALHHGKSRDGRSLYPAFPYPSYSLVTRDDSDALFAYLQTIPAVNNTVPEHRLRFPYNQAWALNIWRALYFNPASFVTNPKESQKWNRGAYLVNGLGHCAACHTPRGAFGNYDNDNALTGTYIDGLGWDTPSLTTGPLSAEQQSQMLELLKTGINKHNVMSGPMAEVTGQSLQYLEHDDLAAMIEYLTSLPLKPKDKNNVNTPNQTTLQLGQSVYENHCSDCHGDDGQGQANRYPALAGNNAVTAASPRNAIRSLMFGGFGASTVGRPRPYGMPSYAKRLSDEEAAAVLSYIRNAWGNTAAAVNASSLWQN